MKKDTLAEVMDVEVIKIGSSNQSFFYLFPIKKHLAMLLYMILMLDILF